MSKDGCFEGGDSVKPFVQVAFPHEDVQKGRITMDVFAADLWKVAQGSAPLDYQDPQMFFRRTYMTRGLKNILEIANRRLKDGTGDPVIQLQTPFGGGKTHALIALYHKAKEWGAKVAVFVGTAHDARDVTPWELLEKQLEGKIRILDGKVSPGKEKIMKLLERNAPVMILMDEILEYATKAAAVNVGNSNLASQLLAFMQEITEAVASMQNALLVITLPSSLPEHYDQNADRLFQQLQKITGRVEKIYTPVEEEEVASVARKRLFKRVDEQMAKEMVDEFVEYARAEGLLSGEDINIYREKFLKSYPFKPDVIDVLYKQWGSFPSFQRTRGVLRLLALVIKDMIERNDPFIRLGDFNLENEEIRRELLKHIGNEYDSVIAQDITSRDSGAKKVDDSIHTSFRSFNLGTAVSTTIFMSTFSGKGVVGTNPRELKLSILYPDISSSIIDTTINSLREKLFILLMMGFILPHSQILTK